MPGPPPPPPPFGGNRRKRKNRLTPQAKVSRFWSRYHTKTPGKVTSIFPRRLYKDVQPITSTPQNHVRNAGQSYEQARLECIAKVRGTVAQCERSNSRFTDHDFDIETDYDMRDYNCLVGLAKLLEDDSSDDESATRRSSATSGRKVKDSFRTLISSGVLGSSNVYMNLHRLEKFVGESDSDDESPSSASRFPQSVHRVSWIFENPQFVIDGYSSSDIQQGSLGDCWWIAAVSNIAHRRDLMDKICVARDEECGIYGFVFHRDGEWISTIVDDNLYLTHEDHGLGSDYYDARGKKARQYKKQKQTGSEALFFSKCENENETWLPLMEKAFAKVHGDFDSISGGWLGCGVEDLTGGVTSFLTSSRILRKDRLWREMLSIDQENGEFVFGVSAASNAASGRKNGLILSHAYSVLKATEVEDGDGKKHKLVKIRNPWGRRSEAGFGEWYGPWSDGSKEWTPDMLKRLRYEFSDDGVFWMSFEDVLETFKWIHRTRLFDGKWTIAQQWTSDSISWVSGYLRSKFVIEVKEEGLVVITLSNLDSRYFRGLEGQYRFWLAFDLRKEGTDDILAEARGFENSDGRSVNCELFMEPGTYEVLPKIMAERRTSGMAVEDVLRCHADKNPRKLRQIGLQYDLAHGRAGVLDEDAEHERRKLERRQKLRKQRQQNQGQQRPGKMEEMKNAMAKMQLAMSNMQVELSKRGVQTDGADDPAISKMEARTQRRTDGGEAVGGRRGEPKGTPLQVTPGLWPHGDLDIRKQSARNPNMDKQPETSQRDQSGSLEIGTGEGQNKDTDAELPTGTQSQYQPQTQTQTQPSSQLRPESQVQAQGQPPQSRSLWQPEPRLALEPQPQPGPEPQPGDQPGPGPEPEPRPSNADPVPSTADSESETSESESESDSGSGSDSESDAGTNVARNESPHPRWNPVCVTCLRVYAQHQGISIKLVKSEVTPVDVPEMLSKSSKRSGRVNQNPQKREEKNEG